MEEANLVCKTPSHTMALRQRKPRNAENDALGSPAVARPSSNSEAGLIGERSVLNAVSLNMGLTGLVPSLESKATRQLRTVKRAWSTFKAKMKPSGRGTRRGAKRSLLDITVTATPRTPEGVLRLMNSPLPLSALRTPSSLHRYRDPVVVTPSTPRSGVRRSERIARQTPTPIRTASRVSRRPMLTRLQSPGTLTNEINRVTSQLSALTQGVSVLEAMETGFTKSIARQESNSSMELQTKSNKDESAKKELKGKRASSLISLKESFQKRLRKQTAGGEASTEEAPGDKTKTKASRTSTGKLQKGQRESSST